ncbi:hypothetical protein H0H87_004846, partial [Tephrocybe sp. NHM501043]
MLIIPFLGHFNEDAINTLRASPDVESIAEDGIVHAFTSQCLSHDVYRETRLLNNYTSDRTNAPWGLSRISQAAKLSSQNA